jgi:anti-sigma factor RsiW
MGRENDMRCEEASSLLVPLLDGELGPSEARLVEDHVGRCRRCTRRLDLLAETTPTAPQLAVSGPVLQSLELAIDRSLDEEVQHPPRAARRRLAVYGDLLGAEVRVPRAMVMVYGLALVAAVLAATVRPWQSESIPLVEGDSEAVAWADEPTASYTPEDAWF